MRFRSLGRHAYSTTADPDHDPGSVRRRIPLHAALIGLIAVSAVSGLAASAAAPSSNAAHPAPAHRPNYLQPVGTLVHHGYLPFPALLGDRGDVGVPGDTPPAPTSPDSSVVAQQAPAIAEFQGADGTLTPAAIATLALAHGCSPGAASVATAIAMAESGGSPGAQGDIGLMDDVWDWSAGLWQIRGLRAERGSGALRDSIANQDADTNAAAMYTVSSGCTDWTPWSTYNTGLYRQFLPIAEQAVRYVVAYYTAHGHRFPPVGAPDPTSAIPVQGSGAPAGSSSVAPPANHRTRSPKPTRSSPTHHADPTAPATRPATQPAPRPAPASSAQPSPSRPAIVLPTRKLTLPPLPVTSILPKPSLTLPVPSVSLSVPSLPGLP